MRLKLLIAAALLAPAPLFAQAEEQLRRAIQRYENLEIEQARTIFQQVISPSSPFPVTEAQRVIAYKYLGATMATLGIRDTAETYFMAAIGRDPLVDLDPRSFSEQERQVFQAAKNRVFRVGLRPAPRDTIDPRSESITFVAATTHRGTIRVDLASTVDDSRVTLFEGEVDGPRDVPFNGLNPRGGGFIPPGAYDLVVLGVSSISQELTDSASTLIQIDWERAALEDTIISFSARDTLPTRQPSSVASRDLLLGLSIAAGALLSSRIIGQSQLEGSSMASGAVAALGVGGGLYAFMRRRSHPEIPENVAENAARQRRRQLANAAIMERNNARIAATKIIVRPLGQ